MSGGNVFAAFAAAAEEAVEKPFLVTGGTTIRFADMLRQSAQAAAVLGAAGVARGDRVLVQVEKSVPAVMLYLGCLRLGAVFVPLNTAYTTDEVGYFLDDAEPALFICSAAARERLAARLVDGPATLCLEADGCGPFTDALERAQPDETIATASPDDVAAILYTSGTTGRSKGAMLTHGNLLSNVRALDDAWRWQADDVLLHALPIFHAHGLFVALHLALLRASTILFHQRFAAEATIADLSRATVMMGVPTFYGRLLREPAFDRALVGHMRLFVSGSAPLTEMVFEAFAERTGHRILERYGMTEALMITSNPYPEDGRVAGTVGYPLPDVRVRLAADGEPGQPGVLEIAGPNVFGGYWRNPEKTAEAFTEDGWFRTGDIASIAGDGRVSLVGRGSDLVISGGFNVYPKEIELLLDEMPGVEEATVIGVPHPDFGEAVVAIVVARVGPVLDPAALSEGLRDRLAAFKRPKRIVVVDELPRNAMGKIEKKALRARFGALFADG